MNMDDWDSILDPYEDALQQGRQEGQEAGLKSGYESGWNLGKIKALEIGIELAYMHSIVSEGLKYLEKRNDEKIIKSSSNDHFERRIKKMKDFLESIHSFPSPNDIFSSTRNPTSHPSRTETNSGNSNIVDNNNSPISAPIDLVGQMQRIRARFKTIIVQMKVSHLTLKKVMNDRVPRQLDSDVDIEISLGSTKGKSNTHSLRSVSGPSFNQVASSQETTSYHDNEW